MPMTIEAKVGEDLLGPEGVAREIARMVGEGLRGAEVAVALGVERKVLAAWMRRLKADGLLDRSVCFPFARAPVLLECGPQASPRERAVVASIREIGAAATAAKLGVSRSRVYAAAADARRAKGKRGRKKKSVDS